MDYFQYRDGVLFCEDADVRALAMEFGTPLYVYSKRTLLDHYDRLEAAFGPLDARLCYSVKSCQNLSILRLLRERGASFDVVSGGELARVLEAGGDPAKVVFAGVGKTEKEIRAALTARIGWFNVESEEELDLLAQLAGLTGVRATAALRVNPDVDPKTHRYTTTGKRETKFGVDLDRARPIFSQARRHEYLDLCGVHVHLGSPVNEVGPYVESITKVLALIDELRADGLRIRAINIGGGFGAHYDGVEAPPAALYAERIIPLLAGRDLQVLLEPGRSLTANAGVLLTRVLYRKSSGERHFVIVDASITELIRPALYGSFHFTWPVEPRGGAVPPHRSRDLRLDGTVQVDVVGPVCESGDYLAKDRWLPPMDRGDLLCVFSAGAYGFVMSSQYNSRPRVAEILVNGAAARLIRRRETYDDLVSAERIA